MPLEIKVGHRYRTRSGDVVEIVQDFNDGSPTPFMGVQKRVGQLDLTWFVTPGGKIASFWHPSPNDLIEELPGAETFHSLWAQTMGQRDELGSVRVTCRMCDGAGCADSVTCENGTEVLPF